MMTIDDVRTADLITDRRTTERRRIDNQDNILDALVDAKAESSEPRQGVERREKVERRRQIDPTTCERDYDEAQVEFMGAMDKYKRRSGRQFPTWSEVLEVLDSLGYRKVAEPTEIEL
jgi:hypothetical protein